MNEHSHALWHPILVNAHGVKVVRVDTGAHFGRRVDGEVKTHFPYELPVCCVDCAHLDYEMAEMSSQFLAGPACMVNVHLPVRKGSCKRKK